jgi:hypothetical protein
MTNLTSVFNDLIEKKKPDQTDLDVLADAIGTYFKQNRVILESDCDFVLDHLKRKEEKDGGFVGLPDGVSEALLTFYNLARQDKKLSKEIKNKLMRGLYDFWIVDDSTKEFCRNVADKSNIRDLIEESAKSEGKNKPVFRNLGEIYAFILLEEPKEAKERLFETFDSFDNLNQTDAWKINLTSFAEGIFSNDELRTRLFGSNYFSFSLCYPFGSSKRLSKLKKTIDRKSSHEVNLLAGKMHRSTTLLYACIALIVAASSASSYFLVRLSKSRELTYVSDDLPASFSWDYLGNASLDLSGYSLNLLDGNGKQITVNGKELSVSSFSFSKIGTQEITISYSDVWKKAATITISPCLLSAPSIKNNNGILSWSSVPNATGYSVELTFVDKTSPFFTDATKETTYDLSNIDYNGSFVASVLSTNASKDSGGLSLFSTSAPSNGITLRKIQELSGIRYEDGAFVWDPVSEITDYSLTINGTNHIVRNATSYSFDTSNAGIYSVSVYPIDDDPDHSFAKALSVDFTKLKAPVVSFAGGSLSYSEASSSVEYYLDGVLFDGSADSISASGSHNVKARNIAASATEITSEFSNILTVNKLTAPILSLSGGVLSCSNYAISALSLSLDGETWDGDMNNVTSIGTHEITAVAKPVGAYDIQSGVSSSITIERLPTPTISFDGTSFSVGNQREGFTIYVDDVKSDYSALSEEFVNSLSAGVHTVRVKNNGNGNDLLPSGNSSYVNLYVPSLDVTVGTAYGSENSLSVKILDKTNDTNSLTATVSISFYKSGALIDDTYKNTKWSVIKSSESSGSAGYIISLSRSGQIADKIVLSATLNDFGTNTVVMKTFEKEYSV